MLIDMGDRICIENIKYLRETYSISRKGLAKLIGISEYALRSMEEGITPTEFTYEQLIRLSQIFNVSPEQIINHILS